MESGNDVRSPGRVTFECNWSPMSVPVYFYPNLPTGSVLSKLQYSDPDSDKKHLSRSRKWNEGFRITEQKQG